eukprot:SAG11_NODE_2111_length_3809_cov_11.810322_2_plen_313_part_00
MLRNQIYRQRSSLTEVFRSFDVDADGYISKDEFLLGMSGKSKSVCKTLRDTSDLNLSYKDATSIFKAMDPNGYGFVDFASFSAIIDEQLPPEWDTAVISEVQKHMHKRGWTAEEVFTKWNYRSDGMLDVLQFTKGVRSFGIRISDKACHLLFDTMDADGDKSVNIDELNERFGFRVAHWDREQTVLQLIANELIGTHKTPMDAFQAFSNNSMRRALTPMHYRNFQLYFDKNDDILNLRLRGFEWKKLFHKIDDDDEDFLKLITQYMATGRVEGRGDVQETALSSAEVFRRVDVNGDGFLEWHEFVEAMTLMR